jgi:RraA family protein
LEIDSTVELKMSLKFIPTADLCDEEEKNECKHLQTIKLKDYGGRARFHGRCVTVRCYEDNTVVSRILTNENGNGKVLVVDGGGSCARALFGDQLAEKVSFLYMFLISTRPGER